MKKRPAALLDVDHTLLFGKDELNQELLDSLKENKIKDLYLFTDMTFKDDSIKDRNQLIEKLEGQGFTVHAVITPADLTWDNMPAEEAKTLYQWCFDGTYSGKSCFGEPFEQFIAEEKKDELPTLALTIAQYAPDHGVLGKGYQKADDEFKQKGKISEEIRVRSFFAKAFADHLSEKEGYQHTKGLLLDLFLCHKPEWVTSILVADDNQDVIESITNFKPAESEIIVPVTMIPVLGKNMGKPHYDHILQHHLNKASVLIINKIDHHIKELSNLILFKDKTICKNQAEALELLKKELFSKENAGQTVSEIIDQYLVSSMRVEKIKTHEFVPVGEVIAKHTLFLNPNPLSKTQKFLNDLKKDFGGQVLIIQEDQVTTPADLII